MEKIFLFRDSATAFLRRKGVDKSQYNDYIKVNEDGFVIELKDGEPWMYGRNVAATKKSSSKSETSKIADVAATKKSSVARRTVSFVCREMITSGKTNVEIWEAIKIEFNLADNKKHYPNWYRSEAARKVK